MTNILGRHCRLVLVIAIGVAQPVMRAGALATVEIIAFTASGARFDSGRLELVDPATGLSSKLHLDGLRTTGVPYGEYILRLRVPGFKEDEQRIRVFQPHVYVRIELRPAQIVDREPLRMIGSVSPPPGRHGELWVRIFPLLMNGPIMDRPIGADGRFELIGSDQGRYLIVIFRGNDCVLTKPIETSSTPIELTVPPR